MALEIERKFLICCYNTILLSDLFKIEPKKIGRFLINQSYIRADKEVEIRLRKVTDLDKTVNTTKFFLTIKGDGNTIREEHEIEISSNLYINLRPVHSYPLAKIRYAYAIDGYKFFVDTIRDPIERTYVEVEFTDPEVARLFKPERYFKFDKEVTEDPAHKMKNVWLEFCS